MATATRCLHGPSYAASAGHSQAAGTPSTDGNAVFVVRWIKVALVANVDVTVEKREFEGFVVCAFESTVRGFEVSNYKLVHRWIERSYKRCTAHSAEKISKKWKPQRKLRVDGMAPCCNHESLHR